MPLSAILFSISLLGDPAPPARDSVHTVVDIPATFPGGITAMRDYLRENTHRPLPAKRAGVHGNVFLNLIVEKDGSFSVIRVMKGLGFQCDQEAVRVVETMPAWQPARKDGKIVSSIYNLIVAF